MQLKQLLPYALKLKKDGIMEKNKKFKSGFVSIIGRPNAGKSTLMNQLIGCKVAIVSDKPQTTRNRIHGILTKDEYQIVFLDTPGIHKPKHLLGEQMVRAAWAAVRDVDYIIYIIDISVAIGTGDKFLMEEVKNVKGPKILVLNKIDQLEPQAVQEKIMMLQEATGIEKVIAISALTGEGVDSLLKCLVDELPEGPQYYPEDMVTDQPERLVVAEMVREKVLLLTKDEVPHSIAVYTEKMEMMPNDVMEIHATIYVERDSQKGIVIGKNGQMLKKVGEQARMDMEKMLGNKVFLQLWVKERKNWREKQYDLTDLGFIEK